MSKKRKQITDANLAKLLPVKRQRYSKADTDQRGLHHRVTPNGIRSLWAVERDQYGKQIWTLLGHWPEMKLEDARERAREIIGRIKAGKPAIEPKAPAPDTLAAVADGWLQRYVVAKGLRSEKDIRRRLRNFVVPKLGTREFASIGRRDFAMLLDYIEDHHGTRQANQTLGDLRLMAGWYAGRDDNYRVPFIKGMRRGTEVSRDRVLNDDELRTIWRAADDGSRFGAIIRLALLTGQRRSKLVSMKWADIRDGVWHVPSEGREKKAGGALMLPKLAMEIIEAQGQLESNSRWIFPGYRGRNHITGVAMLKGAFDKRLAALGWDKIVRKDEKGRPIEPGWTLHDLRRTCRSLMSRKETGITRDAAERVLGHVIGSKVERTYDRDPYIEDKAEALAALARLIERIVAGPPADDGKVVELAQRRA
jgi:integrase